MKSFFSILFIIGFAVALANAFKISKLGYNVSTYMSRKFQRWFYKKCNFFAENIMNFNFNSFIIGLTLPHGTKFSPDLLNAIYRALFEAFNKDSGQLE